MPAAPLVVPRAFRCSCSRPVFFRNSECLACHAPLGYDPELRSLMPIEALAADAGAAPEDAAFNAVAAPQPLWRSVAASSGQIHSGGGRHYQRCANLDSAAACNWLVLHEPGDSSPPSQPALCRCCRLTRTLPDLSLPNAARWWGQIELAKRRLVSSLIALGLPVLSKNGEDKERGLVFDLLRASPGSATVITGHEDGVITLDVDEADDAWREQRRVALGEPYRTLLGHLRHESGHYYWQRLVEPSPWLLPFRELFGDERQDYAAALQQHYQNGPPADWGQRHVSAYASSHPWEDWAETWAHFLHLMDTVDTARSFGLHSEMVDLNYDRFSPDDVASPVDEENIGQQEFLELINGWMELTGVLNEMSRSMGVADFYPFVLSRTAVRKLYLVHRVIRKASQDQAASTGRLNF